MLASVTTFSVNGIESRPVTVEVDLRGNGLPSFTIVGLPDRAVREARERVRAALTNSGFDFPRGRVTVNLAPADTRKAGPAFDLALAVGVLLASGQLPAGSTNGFAICGELSLGGGLRPVHGTLSMALGARDAGIPKLVVPHLRAEEAAIVDAIEVLAVEDLRQLGGLLRGEWMPPPVAPVEDAYHLDQEWALDMADVRGQGDAKRALEIAAAGGHNVLMVGPPGAGKTMLARRVPTILPPPDFEEAIEITQIQSVAGIAQGRLATARPFRAPHHTISPSGLVGGGSVPRPGEITLAHRGVLFLDEVAEFGRHALEALRQPLEEGQVWITRGQRALVFPADFVLVAAANECPCARANGECRCSDVDRMRYARRLSGPLLDRIDLVCSVPPASPVDLVAGTAGGGSSSAEIRARVSCNGSMDGRLTRLHATVDGGARDLLVEGHRRMTLTGRGHDRVLRIARTIADLAGSDAVTSEHVAEALGYRLGALAAVAA